MDPNLLPMDDDREWITWYIEDEEYADYLHQWYRDNQLIARAVRRVNSRGSKKEHIAAGKYITQRLDWD